MKQFKSSREHCIYVFNRTLLELVRDRGEKMLEDERLIGQIAYLLAMFWVARERPREQRQKIVGGNKAVESLAADLLTLRHLHLHGLLAHSCQAECELEVARRSSEEIVFSNERRTEEVFSEAVDVALQGATGAAVAWLNTEIPKLISGV